jgi:hypothetical protein
MKLDIIGDVHKGKRRFEERTIEGCIVRDHDGHPLEQRSDRGVAIQPLRMPPPIIPYFMCNSSTSHRKSGREERARIAPAAQQRYTGSTMYI